MGLAWTAGRVLKAEQPFCVIGYLDLRCLASRSSGDSIFPSSHYELSQARCDDLSRDGDQRGSTAGNLLADVPGDAYRRLRQSPKCRAGARVALALAGGTPAG